MLKKFLIVLLAATFVTLAGCGNSAKESAEKVTDLLNKQDWVGTWNMTSEESKSKTEKKLNQLKSSPMGHQLLSSFLNIAESDIEKLTPQGYFVAILQKGASANPSKTELINVETNGNIATITTSKGGVKTESEMIKEGSDWKVRLQFPE